MAIKVIVELQARPDKREELRSLLESVAEKSGPGAPGFLGSTRYEVLEDPDAWWRSPIGSRSRLGRQPCRR